MGNPAFIWESVRLALIRILSAKTPEILLVLDTGIGHPPAWRVPGGKIEKGETPGKALRREFLEETGLFAPQAPIFLVGHDLPHAQHTRSLMHVAVIPEGIQTVLDPSFKTEEIRAVRWFSLGKMPLKGTEPTSMGFSTDRYNLLQVRDTLRKHHGELWRTGYQKDFTAFLNIRV